MRMTTSCSFGKTAIGHDNRLFIPGNVDMKLSDKNEYLIKCQTIREAYDEIFSDAVSEYNDKQKRNDRKIDSYYDKIQKSKNGEHLSYEYVLQVGSHEINPTGGEYENLSKEIYKEWLEAAKEKYPNLKIINASIHCDEPNGTPHMHITFVPVAHHAKGLALRNSFSGALKEMGYTRAPDWCLDVQKELGEKLLERGIEYEQLGTHREHIENGLYQEMKDKEKERIGKELENAYEQIEKLNESKNEINYEIVQLKADKISVLNQYKNLEKENNELQNMKKELQKETESLDAEIVKKKSFIEKLENKIFNLAAILKNKIKGMISDITVINTRERMEKTLEGMSVDNANEFKRRWNSFSNELPCFELEYAAPVYEKVKEKYFSSWNEFFDGRISRTKAMLEMRKMLEKDGFTQKELSEIHRAIGPIGDITDENITAASVKTAELLESHSGRRISVKREDVQKKYEMTEDL